MIHKDRSDHVLSHKKTDESSYLFVTNTRTMGDEDAIRDLCMSHHEYRRYGTTGCLSLYRRTYLDWECGENLKERGVVSLFPEENLLDDLRMQTGVPHG